MRSTAVKILFSVLLTAASLIPCPADIHASSGSWTIEDVTMLENAGGFMISPDGGRVLWTKSTADKKKDRYISRIFLTTLGDKPQTIPLTTENADSRAPRWSPGGGYISFLRSPEEKNESEEKISGPQIWILDLRGGEARRVTGLSFGVMDYTWISDEKILFLARENPTLREIKAKERQDASSIVEDQDHLVPTRLFILDTSSKKIERLTENDDEITSFSLSNNKKMVFTRNNQSVRFEVDGRIKPKFYLIEMERRSSHEIFPDPEFKPNYTAWDWDDQGLYFTITHTSEPLLEGPGADFLYYYDLASKSSRRIPLDWKRGIYPLGFIPRKDGFIISLAEGARPKWRRYTIKGDKTNYRELENGDYPNIYALSVQEKGDLAVYLVTGASRPPQWFSGQIKGNVLQPFHQLTDLNPHLKNKTMARTEIIRWTGALEEEVEGILYYPHHYREGKRYPLVLMIHGGPTGTDMDTFNENWVTYPNITAGKGAFVLMVNYHGSGGYGQDFAESIKGHYYEYEIPDIVNGIDHLVEKGLVDNDRVAALGWSNGGILTVALSVWTDRIKTAGVGAADVNWISDYGYCAFGVTFDNYYFKGPFWENLDHYIEKSPLFYLKEMTVPTIIFHGTKDRAVPYPQGWEYYRALQQLGKAPVRFLVFPDEPHGLQKISHLSRKMKEEIDWFDKYFFKTPEADNEALKKGSPLDIFFKMQEISRIQEIYGRSVGEALIPETIMLDGLEIGRFEVTRAQWASYDSSYSFQPGTENYPVTGISAEEAKGYVSWLSRITGESYRLPRDKEWEKAAAGEKPGNILDYWAGYELNPDDARRLMKKVQEMKGFAPLLLPVDFFKPSGKIMIFGLKGNAAEWTLDENGQAEASGLCAALPQDPAGKWDPPTDYTGFRVVKEQGGS